MITLKDLDIPEEERFIELRCDAKDESGDFTNDASVLVELIGEDGRLLPSTPEIPQSIDRSIDILRLEVIRYFRHPEVRRFIEDEALAEEHWREMRNFIHQYYVFNPVRLDERGRIAVVRRKNEFIPLLHPIYKEVRKNWLEQISFCLDRGVDGVNIRPTTHYKAHELWEYGFNEPVLKKTGGSLNVAKVARINGEALTHFMWEAKDLVHSHRRTMGVHVTSPMIRDKDELWVGPIPRNFVYQWEIWVKKIADEVEFRGAYGYRPEKLREIIDLIALVAHEANKPLIYQSNRRIA